MPQVSASSSTRRSWSGTWFAASRGSSPRINDLSEVDEPIATEARRAERADERASIGALERFGLTALAHAPFRIFLSANLLSNASWFIFSAGLGWYVLNLTGSAAAVGLSSFIYSLPWALFMLHAGILTDRFGAKPLVAISLAAGGITVCVMAIAAFLEAPLAVVLALAFVMGLLQTLGAPGFISIVNDLVPPRAVSSAVAMTFLGFNIGRVSGGLAAGALLAVSDDPPTAAAFTILVAGVFQAAPALPIWRIRTPRAASRTTTVALFQPLVEAAAHAIRNPTLGVILLLGVAPGAFGLSYMFMLPVVARDLGAGPDGLGILYAGGGIGGLIAGLIAEPLMRRSGHGRAIFVGLAAAAGGLIAAALIGRLPLGSIAVGVAQAGFVVYASASLALIQALSPRRLRGRLTSLFGLLYWGLLPIGGLLGGLVAEATSALVALAGMGVVMIAAGALAIVGRRQVASLSLDRDGQGVGGDLEGSGFERAEPTVEAGRPVDA